MSGPLRERARARLAPALSQVGIVPRPGDSSMGSLLRESAIEALGHWGDPAVMAAARRYFAALSGNPTAIPASIRQPILRTYAWNATPAEWDLLLRLTDAEVSPVAKNGLVRLLGTARDLGLARRALALLEADRFTAPRRAALLRAIAGEHPDLAFDWAVAHREKVDGWLEESSRTGFIPQLGAGSDDPAMPGKINAFAERYLPAASQDPARRAVSAIAVRRATAERLRPATAAWLGM